MENIQMPKYEMPEMSEMLTSLFGGGDAKKTTKTTSSKGVAKRKWEQNVLNQHLDKVIVKQERKIIIINKNLNELKIVWEGLTRLPFVFFFSFHLCVCRSLIQLTAFLFLFIEFSNQSAEEERDSSIHDSEKRQEREKK